jgi:hypothetical protein
VFNSLALIQDEKHLARIIAERDSIIEQLVSQIEQQQAIITSMENERKTQPCPKPPQ